jgi:subtilisin family serine protease
MSRRLLILSALLALVMGALTPVAASATQGDGVASALPLEQVDESTTGSYIVVMEADPLIVNFAAEDLTKPQAKAQAAAIVESHEAALASVGAGPDAKVHDFTNALNGFSALISHEQAVALAANKNVRLVMPDELRQLETDASGEFLGLTGRGAAWASGITGEGIVVGVIDSGIWPEHPSFADDGSYYAPPIPPLDETTYPACDFGNTAHNADDAPFTCNNKLVGARQTMLTYRTLIGADPDEFDSARDDDGHGTHTAATAAGNAGVEASIFGTSFGTVSGVAPRAHVIAYKGLGNLGGFGSDLAASIDQAVADGVDVINYSVGGGATLTGPDDIAFLFAADAGVFVATSAGNSGPGAATIGGPASVPWLTSVGASTQKRFFKGEIWLGSMSPSGSTDAADTSNGESWWGTKYKGASITPGTDGKLPLVDAEYAGGDLCTPGTLDEAVVTGKIVLCRRGAIARAAKSLAVYQAGGAGMILYNNSNDDNLFTDSHWVPSVHVDLDEGLAIKDYIAAASYPKARIKTGMLARWPNAPTMAIFSSRGPDPVAEDIIKPDVTAPGVQILAGASPFPDPGSTPPGELFQAIAGTSMSSPHVAGLFALLKQANPDWTPAMAKSALMTTSHRKVLDNDRATKADPFDLGAGHVKPGKVNKKGSSFNPGIVYDAGFNDYLGFLCDAEPAVFSDPEGTCGALEAAGVPTDASDLNLPSIGIAELAGSQTVTRTVTSVAERTVTWRARVKAPAGYDVVVTPNRLRLAPGETASFEVTISNDGTGEPGVWSFGNLRWKSKRAKAYSPIAVRGSLLDAPAVVSETGTEGSGSFDVLFGYSGDYTAAPHGLSADAPTSGEISQDPDQTYPSPDDGAGVDKIDFAVAGSAFVRWSLVIPGDDDIDLFLENSSGTIIASSTNGGTDELIELVLPPDDTYTMVVHGWSVPNEPLPYTLHFWDVPAAPGGGSLSIDSAPNSATIGGTGTIGYSWTGLTGGVGYLGAVSHSDAGGIIGLTLVEVDG